jgi:hypothetical protein
VRKQDRIAEAFRKRAVESRQMANKAFVISKRLKPVMPLTGKTSNLMLLRSIHFGRGRMELKGNGTSRPLVRWNLLLPHS